jgi:hypothetical protein
MNNTSIFKPIKNVDASINLRKKPNRLISYAILRRGKETDNLKRVFQMYCNISPV